MLGQEILLTISSLTIDYLEEIMQQKIVIKNVYSAYGIKFDSAGSWSLDNDLARNVIIFGVDNSTSSHSDNSKNNFKLLSEGPTYGINESFGSPEKKFNINFTKANTKLYWSLH